MSADPFSLRELPAPARWVLDRVFDLSSIRELYRRIQAGDGPVGRRVLQALEVGVESPQADRARIPERGPLVVVANHPRGAVDGLAVAEIVGAVRPDVRILANVVLARVPELHELCFFVDPFEGPTAAARSRAGLRAAHLWLRRGGALIVFPAGEVASRTYAGIPVDAPWKPTIARLASATGATVLPAWVDGANDRLFYNVGKLHASLRTLLLPRALLSQRKDTVNVRIGSAIRGNPDVATMRRSVEALSDPIASEIASLPPTGQLVSSGSIQVFCAEAAAIPQTLREIGRLREITYRAVGEGTGRNLDLDEYDAAYLHLFAWDSDRRQLVGAYRIGRTDRILEDRGVRGMYTRSLFQYDERLFAGMGAPSLELGRSFVRAEYQKHHSALLMLWRGIGAFIARHPQYRILFGPVSISARYSDTSHALLTTFLNQNHRRHDLAWLVTALNPRVTAAPDAATLVPQSAAEVDRLVSQAEKGGPGMPVLLRQYLKLNARLLGFNIDPAFGEALDALMLVDLADVEPAILSRYLGREGASAFRAFHDRSRTRAA
jgi:putative hemolysin